MPTVLIGCMAMYYPRSLYCMSFPEGNAEHYGQFVSEPIDEYVQRKRTPQVIRKYIL